MHATRRNSQEIHALLLDVEREELAREQSRGGRHDLFISSDYTAVWKYLAAIPYQRSLFLEWGSGMGAITMMAALLGFRSYGIEIQEDLNTVATSLANRHNIDATFVTGSFLPDEFGENPELVDENLPHGYEGADGYVEMGVALEDFDVIYGFPYPGEEELFLSLFRRRAGSHALLLMNHGRDGIVGYRKQGAELRPVPDA